MSTPINVPFSLGNGENLVIPLNRWGPPSYSLQVVGAGTAALNGTLTQLNRLDRVTGVAPTPVWAPMKDAAGTAITAQAEGLVEVSMTPVEAVQIVATGVITGVFQQQGDISR